MRPLLLCAAALALVFLAADARAQPAWQGFYPLAIGDTWEYERAVQHRLAGYRRVAVVGDTTLSGVPYRLVRVTERGPSLEPAGGSLCAVRLEASAGAAEWVSVEGTCEAIPDRPAADWNLHYGSDATETVWIGGTGHEAFTREKRGLVGSFDDRWTAKFGHGIGMLSVHYPGPEESWSSLVLVHAEVGGVSYGVPPEDAGHDPAAYYPLNVGDVRVYARESRANGHAPIVHTYDTVTVIGDTTISGEAFALIRAESYDRPEGTFRQASRCAVRLDEETGNVRVLTIQGAGEPCRALMQESEWDLRRYSVLTHEGPDTELVFQQVGYQWTPVRWLYRFREGVGPVESRLRYTGGPGSGWFYRYYWLLYAEVGGEVVYGTGNPVSAEPAVAETARLGLTAHPNPVSGAGVVRFELPSAQEVSVTLYDPLGRRVRVLAEGPYGAGTHAVRIDGAGLAPGVYVAVLTAGQERAAVRLTLVR